MFVGTVLLAVTTMGCASVPMASREADAAAKRFAPPPGRANLYVYRPGQFKGSAIVLHVRIDDAPFGRTRAGTFLHAEVAPGQYTLISQSEKEQPVTLRAEEGRNYFFEQAIQFGWLEARSELRPMDEPSGRAGVMGTELAASQAPPNPRAAAAAGCTKDVDCKGERVCDAGTCVDPPKAR